MSEDDGLVVMHDDAVLAVPEHGAGKHCAFDVGADTHQIIDGVGVVDTNDVLFDDGPLVENFGHVVGGRADQFDAAFSCALVRGRAGEGWKERMVNVDQRAADRLKNPGLSICM